MSDPTIQALAAMEANERDELHTFEPGSVSRQSVVARADALADARRRLTALQAVETLLRQVYEAGFDLLGDPEDCDDCCDLDPRPCALHGPSATGFVRSLLAVEDVLGPCVCEHGRAQHHEDDERGCKTCGCKGFRLAALAPATPEVK